MQYKHSLQLVSNDAAADRTEGSSEVITYTSVARNGSKNATFVAFDALCFLKFRTPSVIDPSQNTTSGYYSYEASVATIVLFVVHRFSSLDALFG